MGRPVHYQIVLAFDRNIGLTFNPKTLKIIISTFALLLLAPPFRLRRYGINH
jgi:hypothetical protein